MNFFLVTFAFIMVAVSAQKVRGSSSSGAKAPVQREMKKKKEQKQKKNQKRAKETYFLSAEIGTYPGSSTDNGAGYSGTVNLRFNPDDTFLMKLDLSGLLPECTNCGAHVHQGTSCDDAAAPGGHYWNKDILGESPSDDPWNAVSYNATLQGTSTTGFSIDTGFGLSDNDEHAVVIHTAGGGRFGCGVLKKKEVKKNSFGSLKDNHVGSYPGYVGDLDPDGSVEVDVFDDSSLRFSYDMTGLPPNCVSCGVHIHAGLTCDDSTLVFGHYWDLSEQFDDPWVGNAPRYNTDEKGDAKGFFHLFSGYNLIENESHAVVFHAEDGTRVACGVLE